jgi:GT2 family glycosyltransferase
VQEGFLKNCIKLMESNPRSGLVGSTLHFPDGTLQECGAIVWNDATVTEFGFRSNPNGIEFSFSRMVDFCAGAGILLKTKALAVVSFFDELYAPAYYEDTDLAFQLRKFGYEVWVSNISRIVHFGGISYGRSSNSGISEIVEINREKFQSKWADELLGRPSKTNDTLEIFKSAMRWSPFNESGCVICSPSIHNKKI